MRNKLISLVLAATFLISCNTQVDLPSQKDEIWRIGVSTSISWLNYDINKCLIDHKEIVPIISEAPQNSPDNKLDINFRLGISSSSDKFVYLLGYENISIIAHPDNPLAMISLTNLEDIYRGKITTWNELDGNSDLPGNNIYILNYTTGNEIREFFDTSLSLDSSNQVLQHLIPNPSVMLEVVSHTPNSIGYMPSRWVNESVNILDTEDDSALQYPLIVEIKTEPIDSQRILLNCIQDRVLITE